jgi:hypothetical protein
MTIMHGSDQHHDDGQKGYQSKQVKRSEIFHLYHLWLQ